VRALVRTGDGVVCIAGELGQGY